MGVSRQTASKWLAYAELLPVERVMTDNGSGYRSAELDGMLEARSIKHKYTRPYNPWQNGKVERTSRALAQEWQYARLWTPSSSTITTRGRTAPAGACPRCHASPV